MDETRLDAIFAGARERLETLRPRQVFQPPGCLSCERAHRLVIERLLGTATEREHIEQCHRCRQLIAGFEREMRHLSLWALARRRLGLLAAEEAQFAARHLEEDRCARCRERASRLETAPLLHLSAPVALPHPAAAAAATGDLAVTVRSPDGRLEAELFQGAGPVALEVRTKELALHHQLVAYTLRGAAGGVEEGFVVLRPDVQGWFAAQATFDPSALYARLNGACEQLLISPVTLDLLEAVDRAALIAAAERARRSDTDRHAWEAWLASAERQPSALEKPVREIVAAVRVELARGAA